MALDPGSVMPPSNTPARGDDAGPHLHTWLHRSVLAAAGLAVASGYAQFAVFVALGDVARAFAAGETTALLGLSGTTIGIGLAGIRLAALAGLPLSALADRFGRKTLLLACAGGGLALTAAAAVGWTFWWVVAMFALARPLLSATNAVAQVVAAEETRSNDRAKAVALITGSYGVGAGLTAIIRGAVGEALTFRGVFALAVVPLLALPALSRLLEEPERFRLARAAAVPARLVLGSVEAQFRRRLLVLALLALFGSFSTSAGGAYVFAYAEQVLGFSKAQTALLAPLAGAAGLVGLLAGRWSADHFGRRPTAFLMHALVGVTGIITYSGTASAAVAGYVLTLFVGAMYAPALGALTAELFPTRERATAAGWLVAASALGAVTGLFTFGALLDFFGRFPPVAAVVAAPVILSSPLYLTLPETRGLELEQSAPEGVST